MSSVKISLEQAESLVKNGSMTQEAFQDLIANGDIKVFRFREQTNKPQIVQETHNVLINAIQVRGYDLYNAGYKPSIIWSKLEPVGGEEATSE